MSKELESLIPQASERVRLFHISVPQEAIDDLRARSCSPTTSPLFSRIEIIAGLALLANWKTPLALTLLAPVIVNILLFHITMAPAGLPPALFVTILWLGAAYRVRAAFAGLFHDGSEEGSSSGQAVAGLTQTA